MPIVFRTLYLRHNSSRVTTNSHNSSDSRARIVREGDAKNAQPRVGSPQHGEEVLNIGNYERYIAVPHGCVRGPPAARLHVTLQGWGQVMLPYRGH